MKRGTASYAMPPIISRRSRDQDYSREHTRYLEQYHNKQTCQQNQPSRSGPSKHLFWRPKVELDDLINDFGNESDLDMKLGSSILFENRKDAQPEQAIESQTEERYEPYDPEDSNSNQQKEESRVVAPHLVRNAVNEFFSENPHPTAYEIVQLATNFRIRYRAVFDNMEKKRISRGIVCEEGDNCCRIREWIEQENEPIMAPRMSEETKELLEKEVELLVLSRRRFDLGNLHVLVEKTNLRPAFVRFQYQKWRHRLLSTDRADMTIQEWRSDSQRLKDVLSMETLRRLEEMYLEKKYQSDSTEWSDEELQMLSNELNGLPTETIRTWLKKRNGAVDGLPNETAKKPRRTTSSKRTVGNSRTIPSNKVRVLDEEFRKTDNPKKWRIAELAQRLELHETTVSNYFAKRRRFIKREKDWELAREEVLLLPPERRQMLEAVAAEARKTCAENMEHAEKIGVSYATLCSFIDWKKSSKARRYTQYQYDL